MRLRTWLSILGVGLTLSWSYVEAKSLPVIQIGTVRDGPSELVPELRDLIQKEIRELTSGEFDIRFPDDLQLEGGWSVQGVKQAIDRVLAQPRVDLVIALGILASQEVSQRKQLPKPVIAPLIIDPHLQGLPFKKGTSGMKNLSYLVTGKGFERDLEAFKEVFPFTRLTLLADRVLLEAFPPVKDRARKMAETYGVKLTVVPVETSAEAAIGSIPPDTEAVYLSPLPRLLAGLDATSPLAQPKARIKSVLRRRAPEAAQEPLVAGALVVALAAALAFGPAQAADVGALKEEAAKRVGASAISGAAVPRRASALMRASSSIVNRKCPR